MRNYWKTGLAITICLLASCRSFTKYPAHWGQPPQSPSLGFVRLPGDYGFGSRTRHDWIQRNMSLDQAHKTVDDTHETAEE